jgi:hypothetical protein
MNCLVLASKLVLGGLFFELNVIVDEIEESFCLTNIRSIESFKMVRLILG